MSHARLRFGRLALGFLLLAAMSAQANATTIAHFTVKYIDGGGFVDDQDPGLLGDPERYFLMAIFDSSSSSVLSACASGCTVDDFDASTLDGLTFAHLGWSTGVGFWDFSDHTLTKVLAGPGAFFYFGLWDEDNDEDDSLGDHWFFASSATSGVLVSNNNSSPYYADSPIATVGGRDVEGTGDANNFRLAFELTFEQVPDLPGDFDLDSDVDGADFLKWQRGESPDPLSSGDLVDWETNYGTEPGPLAAAASTVPEPGSAVLAMFAVAGLGLWQCRTTSRIPSTRS